LVSDEKIQFCDAFTFFVFPSIDHRSSLIVNDNYHNQTRMAENKNIKHSGDNSLTFTIEGNPKALSRPIISRAVKSSNKAAKFSNKVWLRDPCKEAKKVFRESVRRIVFKGGETTADVVFDLNIPLTVNIRFFLQVPQHLFVNNDRHMGRLKPGRTSSWPTKPDLDNLDKFVLDALQGLIFANDSQIVSQTICKSYDWNPPFAGRTEVHIYPATINNLQQQHG
jgi:Holliday junction resolvase RusA-like endonuclease